MRVLVIGEAIIDEYNFCEALGKSGKEPLIFQSNGSPYRGFLDGRINKNQYQLILRLSNMELKHK